MIPKSEKLVEPSWPDIDERDIQAAAEALRTTFWSRGKKILEFEKKLADYIGTRYAVVTSSGTSALHLAHLTLGIQEGDIVITTPFSFIATANSILFVRALPIFVDIDPTTFNVDPEKVEAKIQEIKKDSTKAKRLKAILITDIFGIPAAWDTLRAIAKTHNLLLIEDACQAFGSEIQIGSSWQKAGTFGDAAVFSFVYNKQISAGGEGGALVTDNKQIADLAQSLKNQGRIPNGTWLDHDLLGHNYHLSDISSAIGISQLERIEEIRRKRARVAQLYTKKLHEVKEIILPSVPEGVRLSWFVYVVRLVGSYSRERRDMLVAKMARRKIPCRIYLPPIHFQKVYREQFAYKAGDFPITEDVSSHVVALPFHSNLTEAEIDLVISNFVEALKKI